MKSKILWKFSFVEKLEPETEPKIFKSQNRNRNKSIRFHNTQESMELY